MTDNETQTRPNIPVGQAIGGALGQAQSVLAGLLVDKVTQAGTDRATYLALQGLGVLARAASGVCRRAAGAARPAGRRRPGGGGRGGGAGRASPRPASRRSGSLTK